MLFMNIHTCTHSSSKCTPGNRGWLSYHGVGSRPYGRTDECSMQTYEFQVHLHIFTEDDEGRAGVSQPHDDDDDNNSLATKSQTALKLSALSSRAVPELDDSPITSGEAAA